MIDTLLTGDVAAPIYSHPLVVAALGGELHPGGEALSREMAKRADLRAGASVLDAACGRGDSLVMLAEQFGCHVTGVDADPVNLEVARSRWPEGRWIQGTVPEALQDLGPFDVVLSECSLCLLGDETLPVLASRLRSGGVLLLSDVTVEGEKDWVGDAVAFAACLGGAGPHRSLLDRVDRAGFHVLWQENRPELLRALRDGVRERIDVDGILEAVERPDLQELLAQAESALEDGSLGYACIVARKS